MRLFAQRLTPSVCLLLLLLPGAALHAQDRSPKQIPASAVRATIDAFATPGNAQRRGLAVIALRQILRQDSASYPRTLLDSVADALAHVAISTRRTNVEETAASSDAITVLSLSGAPDARIPYRGALSRLVRIYREASDPGIRGAALVGIGRVEDPTGLRFLRAVAIEGSPTLNVAAVAAVQGLAQYGGAAGRAVLQELWAKGLVRDRYARQELWNLSRSNFHSP